MPTIHKDAAGTATAKLTIPKGHDEFSTRTLNGCFVKRDANLNAFIDKNLIDDHNKYESSKYLFYSYPVEELGVVSKAVIEFRKISKDNKSEKLKECLPEKEPLVIKFEEHFFLCCNVDIKPSKLRKKESLNDSKFLEDRSTEFKKTQELASQIYGLGSEGEVLKFISLDVAHCPSEGSDIYRINNDADTFNKLKKAGPLLLKKDDNTKFLVGSFRKISDSAYNYRIKVDMFGKNQDQTSTSHVIDGGSSGDGTGNGQTENNPPPAAGAGNGWTENNPPPAAGSGNGQTGNNPPPAAGAGNGQAENNPPPAAGSGNGQAGDNPPPAAGAGNGQAGDNPPPAAGAGNGQQTLDDLFRRKSYVLDGLCLRLDNEYRVIRNWRHLADLLKAPDNVKERCKCGTKHSPTELLLEVPKVFCITVAKLLKTLKEMKRNDVAVKITDKISEAVRNKKISETILNDYELYDEIAQMLDKDSKLNDNWRRLGQKLDVPRDDLNLIGRGNNPANKLLLYVYRTLEPDKLKAGYFRSLVENSCPKRNDVKEFLEGLAVTSQDERSIKDVFPPESDNLHKLCAYLNISAGGTVKNWKNLASAWKIKYDIYNSFDDQEKVSPTKILLQWLIQERIHYTVGELCAHLKQMKRNDVREYVENEAMR